MEINHQSEQLVNRHELPVWLGFQDVRSVKVCTQTFFKSTKLGSYCPWPCFSFNGVYFIFVNVLHVLTKPQCRFKTEVAFQDGLSLNLFEEDQFTFSVHVYHYSFKLVSDSHTTVVVTIDPTSVPDILPRHASGFSGGSNSTALLNSTKSMVLMHGLDYTCLSF